MDKVHFDARQFNHAVYVHNSIAYQEQDGVTDGVLPKVHYWSTLYKLFKYLDKAYGKHEYGQYIKTKIS